MKIYRNSVWNFIPAFCKQSKGYYFKVIICLKVISWMGRWKSEIQIIIFESRYGQSAKNGHLAVLEDIRHGWLALSRGSSNHHLHAMSSLANGFTFRLSNVSLLLSKWWRPQSPGRLIRYTAFSHVIWNMSLVIKSSVDYKGSKTRSVIKFWLFQKWPFSWDFCKNLKLAEIFENSWKMPHFEQFFSRVSS